jgi:two-component system KDP operon response regulator KdpE
MYDSRLESFLQILVIEDHVWFREDICEMISAAFPEARVLQAGNGREGLAIASAQMVDVILLDAHLPDMNGFEVALSLRAMPEKRDIPIIAMTLSGGELSQTLANLQPYCYATLFKPFPIEEITVTIQQSSLSR